jgi:hypothetical protein
MDFLATQDLEAAAQVPGIAKRRSLVFATEFRGLKNLQSQEYLAPHGSVDRSAQDKDRQSQRDRIISMGVNSSE